MPEQPKFYDPSSPNEQAPPLPSAPLLRLGPDTVLQPPLSRRGTGPGLVVLLPAVFERSARPDKPLDPEPVQKWAEEGFAVIGITIDRDSDINTQQIQEATNILKAHESVNVKKSFGLIIYHPDIAASRLSEQLPDSIACLISFTAQSPSFTAPIPLYTHLAVPSPSSPEPEKQVPNITVVRYPNKQSTFVLPSAEHYDPPSANIAHTRSLVFLREHLGGPTFDIEAVWEEHTYWEFERRSVAQTMATMVAEPYVNHVPTMTGGLGRENLIAFYRDNFIFRNPPDTALQPISRTVGPDRVVDEFIFTCTHTSTIPWLLPNIPPTNKRLSIPMLGVINVRGDRLYHEHIWWDQATALRQAGILPSHLPSPFEDNGKLLRLPIAGSECARLLADERDGTTNEMIDAAWAKE